MEHRIAVISDSHGNSTALEAVVTDALKHGAEEFWSLGDMVLGGATSEECLQILDQINTKQALLGNWEADYNLEMAQPNFDLNDPTNVYFTMLVKYENSRFNEKHLHQLTQLPMSARKKLGNLVFSLTHNLPGQNHGHSLYPTQPEKNFDQLTLDQTIDVAIYAHIHSPLWRYSDTGQIILNPGSVGQPWDTRGKLLINRAASYLLLTVSTQGIEDIDFRRAPYDPNVEIQKAEANNFPYVELERKLLLTGNASTHNKPLLKKINAAHHYDEEAAQYLQLLQKRAAQ